MSVVAELDRDQGCIPTYPVWLACDICGIHANEPFYPPNQEWLKSAPSPNCTDSGQTATKASATQARPATTNNETSPNCFDNTSRQSGHSFGTREEALRREFIRTSALNRLAADIEGKQP